MSAIGSLASGLLHAVLPASVVQLGSAVSHLRTAPTPPIARPPDTGQLSPLGQLVGRLQQLQQSNIAQYQQVTQQISGNLQAAAGKAQSGGHAAAARQLNLLSTDFRTASASGQLPNLQDFAGAVGGHRSHGYRFHTDQDHENGPLSASTIISNGLNGIRIES